MCELFAMSSRIATTVGLSIGQLARRGNQSGRLGDGWGVGFYDENDARLFREPEPADESAWVRFLAERPIRSQIILSHLRHATQGDISLRNTQPFARELGGRIHLFIHNGNLQNIEQRLAIDLRRYRPIGSTDSEVAFCVLLERLAPLWTQVTPSPADRLAVVARLAAELREIGPANFIYSDGELLFAHGHRRIQPDRSTAPPGLTLLHRECGVDRDALASAGVRLDDPQTVTLLASVPLTDEPWQPLREGEIVVIRDGEVVATA